MVYSLLVVFREQNLKTILRGCASKRQPSVRRAETALHDTAQKHVKAGGLATCPAHVVQQDRAVTSGRCWSCLLVDDMVLATGQVVHAHGGG